MGSIYTGVVVTFRSDIDEDDIGDVVKALKMIKGVLDVRPVERSFDASGIRERVMIAEKLNAFTQELLRG